MARETDSRFEKEYPPHLERKKKSMMKRRKKVRVKRRFIVILFLLICAGVILTAFKAPFFDISKIICEGQGDLPYEQILKESGLTEGQNIFKARVREAEEKLALNPEIEKAEVQRVFPNQIKIKIERAVPTACVENEKKFLIIDPKGNIIRVIEDQDDELVKTLIRIKGVQIASVEPGKCFAANGDVRAGSLYDCLEILKKNGMIGKSNVLDMSDLSDIKLEYENRLDILLGNYSEVEYKLKFVKKVIEEQLSVHEKAQINCRGEGIIVGPRGTENDSDEEINADSVDENENNVKKKTESE